MTKRRSKIGFFLNCCVLYSVVLLSACCYEPTPFTPDESYLKAKCEIQSMFAHQAPIGEEIDFNQAMARALQYNLDNRVKLTNLAIKVGQTRLAEYAMLPVFGLSYSVYNRSNDNATFGSNPDGSPNRNQIAFGADRTIRSARIGLSWNLIDSGMGYVKTREQGERILIAEEEARQQLQKLVQDVRVAYWGAYSAQQLAAEVKQFHVVLEESKNLLEQAFHDKIIPKLDLLNFQTALLDSNRRMVGLEDKLRKAELIFKYLINLPVDKPLRLNKPPVSLTKIQDLRNLNFEKLDAITLVNRPELRSQGYQRRIAELGTKTAILQALPVLTLNGAWNYNSNSFLLNNFWNDRSIEASWNIFNLAALPVSLRVVETQIKYESLKLMALTLGALNETRIAFAHYQNLVNEAKVAHKQTVNATRLYTLLRNREYAALGGKQQVVLAKLQMLFAKMDEILLLADLSNALGQLYIASGFDVLPLEATAGSMDEVLCIIENNLIMQEKLGFKGYVDATFDELFDCCNS